MRQVPSHPQISYRKFRNISTPCGVWVTSGWNWTPCKFRPGCRTAARGTSAWRPRSQSHRASQQSDRHGSSTRWCPKECHGTCPPRPSTANLARPYSRCRPGPHVPTDCTSTAVRNKHQAPEHPCPKFGGRRVGAFSPSTLDGPPDRMMPLGRRA